MTEYISTKNCKNTWNEKNFVLLLLIATFFIGYAFKSITTKEFDKPGKRVNSIGGIFFKCKDPKKLKEWYNIHLGLQTNQYGTAFEWRQACVCNNGAAELLNTNNIIGGFPPYTTLWTSVSGNLEDFGNGESYID